MSPPVRSEPLACSISPDMRQLVNSQSATRVEELVLTKPAERHPATVPVALESSILPVKAQRSKRNELAPDIVDMNPAQSALALARHSMLPPNSQSTKLGLEVLFATNPPTG